MRRYIENYYIYFFKPIIMIICFINNYLYLLNSRFVNNFYYFIYIITFGFKPFFFLLTFISIIYKYKITSISEGFPTFLIISGIFFGFPVYEISEFLQIDTSKKFFLDISEEYFIDEYLSTHYIVNMLIENIPIIIFLQINNLFIETPPGEEISDNSLDSMVVNLVYIILNGLIICFLYCKRRIN